MPKKKKEHSTKIGWFKKLFGSEYRIIKVKKGLKPGRILVFGTKIYIRED